VDLLQVVAEPRRREILRLVWDDERNAGAIADQFDVTFGAVSQHLRVLMEAGLVTVRRNGRERWYRAERKALGPIARQLESMWHAQLMDLKRLAEDEEHARKVR
jgi:DNA-binding transcriptional ArsR family regulator